MLFGGFVSLSNTFQQVNKPEFFSEQFKIAKLIPFFTEGEKDNFSDYRPISLLPVISKVFERIIFKRVNSYVEKFKILDYNHF